MLFYILSNRAPSLSSVVQFTRRRRISWSRPGTIRIAKLASAADDRLNDVIGVKVVSLAKQIQQQQQVQQNTATSHTCLEQYYSALIPITSI